MGLRDPQAGRAPGAEHTLDIGADVEDVELPEYAADLSAVELAKLVAARKQRQLAEHLPADIPGSGTRRDSR